MCFHLVTMFNKETKGMWKETMNNTIEKNKHYKKLWNPWLRLWLENQS
jgi:hypothetical protein